MYKHSKNSPSRANEVYVMEIILKFSDGFKQDSEKADSLLKSNSTF